jgi:hypothetical protein
MDNCAAPDKVVDLQARFAMKQQAKTGWNALKHIATALKHIETH